MLGQPRTCHVTPAWRQACLAVCTPPSTPPSLPQAINEFTSSHWMRPDPNNPGALLGIEVLQFRGLQTDYWWCE